MNRDFVDLLRALSDAEARFLVVGAFAVGRYTRPRATGDLDVWIDRSPANARRVHAALRSFGAPLADLRESELTEPDLVFQMGVAPGRIDLLTSITGVEFDSAWARRETGDMGGVSIAFIGREDLIRNKRAVGRPRDLADASELEGG
jgi:hypothetical protein